MSSFSCCCGDVPPFLRGDQRPCADILFGADSAEPLNPCHLAPLLAWGLTSDVLASATPDAQPARLLRHDGHTGLAQTADGPFRVSWRHTLQPCAGDWAWLRDGEVVAVAPRHGVLARRGADKHAAPQAVTVHVDVVLVATAVGSDFSPERVRRGLVLAAEAGARAMVVLTKLDLCEDPQPLLAELSVVAAGAPVVGLSVVDGCGVDDLRALLLPGRTHVLLGSSGIGKSSLCNTLSGDHTAATQAVRRDGKGRHTTTARQLWAVPGAGGPALLIDTPGIRALGLWAGQGAIRTVFAELVALAEGCRFADCQHQGEPGCAVAEAVAAGSLHSGEAAAWSKLQAEATAHDRAADPLARLRAKGRDKAQAKALRQLYQDGHKRRW